MCFVGDLREHGQNAEAIFHAAVLASRIEKVAARPEFTGLVMLHAAQYFAERAAEVVDADPAGCLLAMLVNCGIDSCEIDAELPASVVSRDAEAGRFFEQRLKTEAADLVIEDETAARLAVACIVMARTLFADFALQAGVGADKGHDICAAAAHSRMLRYEVVH